MGREKPPEGLYDQDGRVIDPGIAKEMAMKEHQAREEVRLGKVEKGEEKKHIRDAQSSAEWL